MQQTDIGMIPVDWELRPLSELGEPKIGLTYSPSDVCESGTLVLRSSNVQNDRLAFDDNVYVRPEIAGGSLVEQGDILICVRNGSRALIGKCAQIDASAKGMAFGAFMSVFRSPHSAWLFQHFRSDIIARQIAEHLGATINQITNSSLKSFRVPFPPDDEERRRIAQALSDIDDLIASLDALIAKKRDIKQGAMQQLLSGKRRLPGFPDKGFQVTDFGQFPSDWRPISLASLMKPGRSIRYGIVQPGDFDPQGRYMIRGQDYSSGWAAEETIFRVGDKIEERYANARVATSDLIMTIVGYCGTIEEIPQWLDGANLTQTTARLSVDPKKAAPSFVKHMLRSPLGSIQVRNCLKSGAQPGLNCGDVEKMVVLLPSDINEQQQIGAVLDALDRETEDLRDKLRKYSNVRQGMMQQLLTGRIRLV